jgi:putative PEP-CTERM system TPR-repeat lipoprotein
MSKFSQVLVAVVLAGTCAVTVASCSADPDARKREYFDSGNRYFEQKKYAEAIVEYRNAVQIDHTYGEAYERLSEALFETGDVSNAVAALVRAADLMPSNAALQLKTGSLLLLSNRFDGARVRAEKALAVDGRNVEAHILKANALAGLKDFGNALSQIDQAAAVDPKHSPTFTALGTVRAARGEDAEAEAAFRQASDLDPRSVSARLALGNFYWTRNRLADAEAAFNAALTLDPRNRLANRALATFFVASGRVEAAERFLVALAEEDRDPAARLSLADYYVRLRRYEAAQRALEPLAADRARGSEARLRLAAVTYLQGRTAEAYKEVDDILMANPNATEALLTRARFLMSEGKMGDAAPYATRAVESNPDSVAAHYLDGTIQASLQNIDTARRAFTRVVELNPNIASAQVQLAEFELQRGNAAASLQHAQSAMTAQPQNAAARLLVAKSYFAENNIDAAERELKALVGSQPNSAAVHSYLGFVHLRRRNPVAARAAFEKALTLDPMAFEPLSGLIGLDVREGNRAQASSRIDARLATAPSDPNTMIFAGRAYLLLNDAAKSEQLLRSAIERDPSNLQAYADLAQIYFSQGQLDVARASFERVVQQYPGSVPARTMIGVIHQIQNKPFAAIQAYEQVLSVASESAVAANNLAWLYAERGEKLERAVELAITARRALPDRAEISDTLGFVYLKKNAPDLAVPTLREAVKQDPENPRYRLRLGLALALSGKPQEAEREIAPVLRAHAELPEAIEARAVLDRLR